MSRWTLLLRFAGIVVGIATLLRIATMEGFVTYDPLFQSWMDGLRDWLELGLVMDALQPILGRGIELVRSFGYSVPDLQDEWRPALVLSTLMFGRIAQHSRIRWLFAAAPVGALVIAMCSGLTGSFTPVAAAAYAATFAITAAVFDVGFALTLVAAAVGFAFPFARAVGTPTNASFVVPLVAAVGVLFLFLSIIKNVHGGLRAVLANANFNVGVDILGVMLGALFIASLAANSPIW